MDPMKRVAAGAVRKNLGPDPSMGRKVELLRRLVSMRQENVRRKDPGAIRRDPKATTNPPVRRPGYGVRPAPGGGFERVPGGKSRRPLNLRDKPGYNFGPPRGM